jgi:hypothetical protein
MGPNTLVEFVALVGKLTGGDAFKVGEVLGDMQALSAVVALLAGADDYRAIKAKADQLLGAVDAQFARRMAEDPTKGWERLSITLGNLTDRIGTALLPMAQRLAATLGPILDRVGAWADRNPELAARIETVAAAVGGLLVVAALVLLTVAALAGSFGMMAGALGLLLVPIAMVAAVWYFRNEFVAFLSWLGGLAQEWTKIGSDWIAGLWKGMQEKWVAFKAWVSGVAKSLSGIFRQETDTHSPSRVFAAIGSDLMRGLQVGIAATERLPKVAMAGVAGGLMAVAAPAGAHGAPVSIVNNLTINAPQGIDAPWPTWPTWPAAG